MGEEILQKKILINPLLKNDLTKKYTFLSNIYIKIIVTIYIYYFNTYSLKLNIFLP